MMGATQPFLSGAISKTVNLPNEATVEDIEAVYEEGWRLGLKAVALYRDGCKASQPLSTGGEKKKEKKAEGGHAVARAAAHAHGCAPATPAPQLSLNITPGTRLYGQRERLPKKRHGFTQEARVGGHKIFLRTGEYEDGRLGEIFIDMHKEGAAFRALMNCFAMSVSIGLQYGVPLQTYVDQFTFTRFEPQGPVEGHPNVKFATSIVDFIFRALGVEYLQRYDLAHIKPELDESRPRSRPPTAWARPPSRPAFGTCPRAPTLAAPCRTRARPPLAARRWTRGWATGSGSPLDAQLDTMMGDAPVCDVCGHITVRNGACYKCLNCGNDGVQLRSAPGSRGSSTAPAPGTSAMNETWAYPVEHGDHDLHEALLAVADITGCRARADHFQRSASFGGHGMGEIRSTANAAGAPCVASRHRPSKM